MRAPVFDYYAILGVDRAVGAGPLRRAYRTLALRFHPDRAGVESTEVFQRISEAYRVLSDTAERAAYDGRLREAEGTRVGTRAARGGGGTAGDAVEGDFYGPGGKISWRRGRAERHRVDDLIDRLCGTVDALVERGAARRGADGVLELCLEPAEAKAGGTAAIDTPVQVVCPTCLGHAGRGRLWCRRCEYVGTVREDVTVCVPIPASVADGTIFNVAADPAGHAPPLRVRIRV
jgi:DnaJ-class molecular chaperone